MHDDWVAVALVVRHLRDNMHAWFNFWDEHPSIHLYRFVFLTCTTLISLCFFSIHATNLWLAFFTFSSIAGSPTSWENISMQHTILTVEWGKNSISSVYDPGSHTSTLCASSPFRGKFNLKDSSHPIQLDHFNDGNCDNNTNNSCSNSSRIRHCHCHCARVHWMSVAVARLACSSLNWQSTQIEAISSILCICACYLNR